MTAELLAARTLAGSADLRSVADKWAVLRDLGTARRAFGVTDRDLTVLQALLSFHPDAALRHGQPTIVFPSNASLGARAHGMPESTLRRHLAALVKAGLVLRHDSPNGKRYAARGRAFGFDLAPLVTRAAEIAAAAQEAREEAQALHDLREAVVLALRDASKLITYGRSTLGGCWEALAEGILTAQRALRRKLGLIAAKALLDEATALRDQAQNRLPRPETSDTSGNDAQNERHIQVSDKDLYEPEALRPSNDLDAIPLATILQICPDVTLYSPGPIKDWRSFISAMERIGPMLGIDRNVLSEAQRAMGREAAGVVIACLLQSMDRIRNPGAYLRTLARKAAAGRFTPTLMLRALVQRSASG